MSWKCPVLRDWGSLTQRLSEGEHHDEVTTNVHVSAMDGQHSVARLCSDWSTCYYHCALIGWCQYVDDDHSTWSQVTMFRKYMEHILLSIGMSFTDSTLDNIYNMEMIQHFLLCNKQRSSTVYFLWIKRLGIWSSEIRKIFVRVIRSLGAGICHLQSFLVRFSKQMISKITQILMICKDLARNDWILELILTDKWL